MIYHCSNNDKSHNHCKNGYNLCVKCVTQLCVYKIVLDENNSDGDLKSKSDSDNSNEQRTCIGLSK